MRYASGQFGSFEGLDNRRTVMGLFRKMGEGLPDDVAGMARAGFLQGLVARSINGFAARPVIVTPCTTVEAYFLFTHICGCLGVDVTQAAVLLEQVVRAMK